MVQKYRVDRFKGGCSPGWDHLADGIPESSDQHKGSENIVQVVSELAHP